MKATLLLGCAGMLLATAPAAAAEPLFFSSPETAITRITELLRARDWPALARHYDLSNSKLDRSQLESGTYFIGEGQDSLAHPGLPKGYSRPFVPGFKFDRVEEAAEAGVFRVMLKLEVDQGGGQIQRGFASFPLRKSDAGYQVLPNYTEHLLNWNGEGEAVEILMNSESLGKGPAAVKALMDRIAKIEAGDRVVIQPYVGDPAGGKRYPFDLGEFQAHAASAGVVLIIPKAR